MARRFSNNVTDAAGTAAIVLQHHVSAVRTADQVRAADVNINVLGDIETDEFAAEMFAGKDEKGRNDAVLDDFLLVVNVAQEKIERGDTLDQAAFQMLPFAGRDDAGNQVEGKNPLHALGVTIDIEGDALAEKSQADCLALVFKLLTFEGFKHGAKVTVMGTDLAVPIHHFIKKVTLIIFSQHSFTALF